MLNVNDQPISTMKFEGLHWIEASAGTGKTYTLSSLMVRIFLEKYLPNQVIATTFTRAAAAELKSRIRLRVLEALELFERCQQLTQLEIQQYIQVQTDPLLHKILTDYADKVDYALARLKLVRDQFDQLFVGTLDSFSQKILREFSFESGTIDMPQISENTKNYTKQLLHDGLRNWIQLQPEILINYLISAKKIKDIQHYLTLVETGLNFSSVYFEPVKKPTYDFAKLEKAIHHLTNLDLSKLADLENYFLQTGAYYALVTQRGKLHLKIEHILLKLLPDFITALKQDPIFTLAKKSPFESILGDLKKISIEKKVFNKCNDEIKNGFYQHEIIQALTTLFALIDELNQYLDQLEDYLKFYLFDYVKKHLPELLAQKQETTFSQQIQKLAEALKGIQGKQFAQHIHEKYPLILVDEFQDTNQDQEDMLASIWRNQHNYMQGCMIMVGDPKQAIYGFRGGDMLTFNKAKTDVLHKKGCQYTLRFNHRSVKELVEVVDALFQRNPNFGDEIYYFPVTSNREHIALVEEIQDVTIINPFPLRWISIDKENNESQQIARKIHQLLTQSVAGKLYLDLEKKNKITVNDIAVLAADNVNLDKIQYELESLGILVNRSAKRSVFDSVIAQDIAAVLTAVLDPYDEGKIKRALLTRLFNFNLSQLFELQNQPQGLSEFIYDFDQIREIWVNQGFLTAWQSLFNRFQIWSNLVAQKSRDNDRFIVNLRHLSEILTQYSEHYQGVQHLYQWYLKQLKNKTEREWELERKLSQDEGVQLMTIHRAKGLEFKIVFLMDADADIKVNNHLNFDTKNYIHHQTGKEEKERIISLAQQNLSENQKANNLQRALAENHRLWYVALTRASHRVYVMLNKPNSTTGLAFWRNNSTEIFNHFSSIDEGLLTEIPSYFYQSKSKQMTDLVVQNYPKKRFYAQTQTSFSALSQHQTSIWKKDLLVTNPQQIDSAEDEISIQYVAENQIQSEQAIDWIRLNFPKGTQAGNFLHQVFEKIQFDQPHEWHVEIHRRFKNEYAELWKILWEKYSYHFDHPNELDLINLVGTWLKDVLTTTLYEDFSLKKLGEKDRLSEFPFYLALAKQAFITQRIHDLFLEYDYEILTLNSANSARYLTGSIDLVFFDGKKYQIADYKSNFLGEKQSDYSIEQIKSNMSKSSYWLQAALYLVALHRYLKTNLKSYAIEQHLGGATYLYLRGMNGQPKQGAYFWKPEDEFILRLDALLGSDSYKNNLD